MKFSTPGELSAFFSPRRETFVLCFMARRGSSAHLFLVDSKDSASHDFFSNNETKKKKWRHETMCVNQSIRSLFFCPTSLRFMRRTNTKKISARIQTNKLISLAAATGKWLLQYARVCVFRSALELRFNRMKNRFSLFHEWFNPICYWKRPLGIRFLSFVRVIWMMKITSISCRCGDKAF